MSDKTPKNKFLDKLLDTIKEFEDTTGAEIFSINIIRGDIDALGCYHKKTLILEIILEMK